MAEHEEVADDAADQIKNAVWQWTGWTIMILLTFLAGVAIAWLFWGDAPKLKAQLADQYNQLLAARKEREEISYKLTRANTDLGKCQEKLASVPQTTP